VLQSYGLSTYFGNIAGTGWAAGPRHDQLGSPIDTIHRVWG
jgi:hypothetical protein